MCPEDRVAIYGHALAPLTRVLPPVETGGRQDPIAALGRGMNRRQAGKKLERATKDLSEGKVKKWQRLEKGLKWVGTSLLSSNHYSTNRISISLLYDVPPLTRQPTGKKPYSRAT